MFSFNKWYYPLLALFLVLPSTVSASSSQDQPAGTLRIVAENGVPGGGSIDFKAINKNNVLYVSARSLAGQSRLTERHIAGSATYRYDGYRKNISFTIGSPTGKLDFKNVSLGGKPFLVDGEPFVPANFIVGALGGTSVKRNSAKQTTVAKGLRSYPGASTYYAGLTYTLDYATGTLYTVDESGTYRKLAALGAPVPGVSEYDVVDMSFRRTKAGLLYLTLVNTYGEPHINTQEFQLVIKKGRLIRQSKVGYHGRYAANATGYGDVLALTDGKQLRLIEDGTGNVLGKLDLAKLGGEDDNYFVEGIDEDFVLLRANKSGMLKLYDRNTSETVLLYKELLDPSLFEIVETYSQAIIGGGDYLVYMKREGDTLLFRNDAPYVDDKARNKVYRYDLSDKS